MDHQSWDVDFSRLKSFVLYRKNLLGLFLSLIIGPAFITIFLVFAILFLLKVPMEINDVIRYYYEMEYQEFFQVFLWVFGIISLSGILIGVLTLLQKPKPYLYFGQNLELEDVLFVIEKKYQLYLDNNRMIRYDPINSTINESKNLSEISSEKKRLLFWRDLDSKEKLKISQKTKKTKIRYQDSFRRKIRVVTITICYDEIGHVVSYSEMINSRLSGNQSIDSVKEYYFRDVNQYQRIPLPKAIQDLISSI